MATKPVIAGEDLCEFVIPQIDSCATGILHPEYEEYLGRARQHPKVGVLREYKKGKFSLFSVQFFADMKNVAEWCEPYKFLATNEELVNYIGKLGISAEKFLVDFHKTNKISTEYDEWIAKHILSTLRERLDVPLKRQPPKRDPSKKKEPSKKPSKKKEAKETKEDKTPSALVTSALESIKSKKISKKEKKSTKKN